MKINVKSRAAFFTRTIVFLLVVLFVLIIALRQFMPANDSHATDIIGQDEFVIPIPDGQAGSAARKVAVTNTGEVFVVYGAPGTDFTLYRFNVEHELVYSTAVGSCSDDTVDSLMINGLTSDQSGAAYVSMTGFSATTNTYSDACVQKFDATGTEVPAFRQATAHGVFYDGIFADAAGTIYLVSRSEQNGTGQVVRLSSDGENEGTVGDGSDEQTPTLPSSAFPISDYQGNVYIYSDTSDDAAAYKVYDADGTYIKTIPNTQRLFANLGIDEYGYIYTDRGAADLTLYDQNNVSLGSGIMFDFTIDGTGTISSAAKYLAYFHEADQSIHGVKVAAGPRYAPIVEASDITNTSVKLTVETDEREPSVPAIDTEFQYFVYDSASTVVASGVLPYTGGPMQVPVEGLIPGSRYVVYASFKTAHSQISNDIPISFDTTGVQPSGEITGVTLSAEEGKKVLSVAGTGFGNYASAIADSRVTLNGQQLPFCLDGTGLDYDTAQQYYPVNMLGTAPPCYWIIQDLSVIAYINTQVSVWLPEGFDMGSEGTVSVNGSVPFVFNEQEGGEETQPTQPTIETNTGVGISNTPTLASKPVFTGRADPGATVKVTIHSDPVECATTTNESGYWRCEFTTAVPDGLHMVYVQVTRTDATVTELGPYPVVVASIQSSTSPSQSTQSSAKQTGRSRGVAYVANDQLSVIDDSIEKPASGNDVVVAENKPSGTPEEADSSGSKTPKAVSSTMWVWIVGGIALAGIMTGIILGIRKVRK